MLDRAINMFCVLAQAVITYDLDRLASPSTLAQAVEQLCYDCE